jgi:hypothetical protein
MTISEGQPCGCGSGLPRRSLLDGNGLFCAYVCTQCEDRVRARYRPETWTGPTTKTMSMKTLWEMIQCSPQLRTLTK